MTIDYDALANAPRLLMEAKLKPLQGNRFQATGFADLGPARYTLPDGTEMLLIESAQSVANRMELACWDTAKDDLIPELAGLPYILVLKPNKEALTNSVLESHRINSEYITADKGFVKAFCEAAGYVKGEPIDWRKFHKALLKYDVGSVLHGAFVEEIDGRLRATRVVSGFIEAENVQVAESGGTKASRVDPTIKGGGGNVVFHRTEFVGEIRAYFNLDLALLHGYGLGDAATNLLVALALFKIRKFLSQGLRLRTACDLEVDGEVIVKRPANFTLPIETDLLEECKRLIGECAELFAKPQKDGNFQGRPVTIVEWKSKEEWITVPLPVGTEKPEITADLAERIKWKSSKKNLELKFKREAADEVKTLLGGEETIVTLIDEALNPNGADSADDPAGEN